MGKKETFKQIMIVHIGLGPEVPELTPIPSTLVNSHPLSLNAEKLKIETALGRVETLVACLSVHVM